MTKQKNVVAGAEHVPELAKLIRKLMGSKNARAKRIGRALRARECGDCQLCCRIKQIREPSIESAAYENCQHQCEAGCAIHDSRPMLCKDYLCAWRLGYGPERARPDKAGALVDSEDQQQEPLDHLGHTTKAAVVRFEGPFEFGPIAAVCSDMSFLLGIEHVGFTDPETDHGQKFAMFGNVKAITTALQIAASIGRAPWNGTQDMSEINKIVLAEVEKKRNARE